MAEPTTGVRSTPALPARDEGDSQRHWAERPAIAMRGTATPDLAGLWDAAALTCAALLEAWAREHAADYRLSVRQVERYVWRSYEDPRDVDLVLKIRVQGSAEDAEQFWDAASCELDALIERHPSASTERLWIDAGPW